MTALSASALDLDSTGCALDEAVTLRYPARRADSVWLRASVGFVGSTLLTIVILVMLAGLV